MYSIKIESKPSKCKDCLFCRDTKQGVYGCSGSDYCSIRIKLIEDVYKIQSWCPILKNKEKPSQLNFSYEKEDEEYTANGTNNQYEISLFENNHEMVLFVTPSLESIARRESKTTLKYNSKKYKRLLNEIIKEAQLYENSCYAPVRAKRKDVK